MAIVVVGPNVVIQSIDQKRCGMLFGIIAVVVDWSIEGVEDGDFFELLLFSESSVEFLDDGIGKKPSLVVFVEILGNFIDQIVIFLHQTIVDPFLHLIH